MNGVWILLVSMAVLLLAYLAPGFFLAKGWGIQKGQLGIGSRKRDDMDYIPASTPVLLGQHFSSVAGVGFLAGTIQAASFGWLSAMLWLLIGGVFFGALFDYSSLLVSVRNQGKSIGAVMRRAVSPLAGTLVMVFSWICLVMFGGYLVDIVSDILCGVKAGADGTMIRNAANGSVAMAVLLFLALSVMFGFINRARMNLALTTGLGVLLLAAAIGIGMAFPIFIGKKAWMLLLLGYVFLAAVAPVWVLLQSKNYLSSILFFALIFLAVVGICLGRPTMEIPAFANWINEDEATIFPALFLYLSSGTVSGLHGLTAAGTTSKQIKKETQMRQVGYGSMLLVCLVSVIALVAVGSLDITKGNLLSITEGDSTVVWAFAEGLSGFFAMVGLKKPAVSVMKTLVLLIIGTLALTSLDAVVRSGRYLLQELFDRNEEKKNYQKGSILTTLVTVLAVGAFSFGGYQYLWRLFDGANMLLAAMLLVGISCWMKCMGRKYKMYYLLIAVLVGVAWSDLGIVFIENMNKMFHSGWEFMSLLQNLGILFMMVVSVLILTDGIKAILYEKEEAFTEVEESPKEEEELPLDWEDFW